MRYYFRTKCKGRSGCAGHSAWRYTDKYVKKSEVSKRFKGTGSIEVLTEKQFAESYADTKAICWD